YLLSSIKILAEYERGVIFRLGRLLPNAKGPGIILVFAPIDRMVRVSLRQEALEVPPQDIITRDNVTLKVNAVIFLRVIEPRKAVVEVSNYVYQTSQFAQTTLRSVLGEQELDELLAHRDKINLRLQSILDTHTAPWGVKVANVEVKQVDMPESMLRAMANRAQAAHRLRARAEGFRSNNEVGIWRTPKIPKSHWAREKCWLYFSALWRCALFFSGWDFRWERPQQRQAARE